MHYIDEFKGQQRVAVPISAGVVSKYGVGNLDVLMVDLENVGIGPLTALQIFARISAQAPMRDLTPSAWTTPTDFLWRPAAASPAALAVGANASFGLNVSAFYEVELRAAGAGAVLQVNAGGYKVQP